MLPIQKKIIHHFPSSFFFLQKEHVNNYKMSLYEIADKSAGPDTRYRVFDLLISLGKMCVMDEAKDRPDMVEVYMNLHNTMSSNTQKST